MQFKNRLVFSVRISSYDSYGCSVREMFREHKRNVRVG